MSDVRNEALGLDAIKHRFGTYWMDFWLLLVDLSHSAMRCFSYMLVERTFAENRSKLGAVQPCGSVLACGRPWSKWCGVCTPCTTFRSGPVPWRSAAQSRQHLVSFRSRPRCHISFQRGTGCQRCGGSCLIASLIGNFIGCKWNAVCPTLTLDQQWPAAWQPLGMSRGLHSFTQGRIKTKLGLMLQHRRGPIFSRHWCIVVYVHSTLTSHYIQ